MLLNKGRHPYTNETIIPEEVVEHVAYGRSVSHGKPQSHRKVHVFSSAKNNIYLINFGGEIGQSKSINLSENFRIA